MLRDQSLMVCGQAFEGNCWTKFKKLYYDAWWSPIAYQYGTNAAWDIAGQQGEDDKIYNFTQLKNGNLVFVGKRGFGLGMWSFVTDSTGKNVLCEIITPIPYKSDPAFSVRQIGNRLVISQVNLAWALGANHELPAGDMKISLFDLAGRKMLCHVLVGAQHAVPDSNSSINLDISHLPKGLYFVRIKTESGVSATRVVIK